jgi:hypothetical protein
MSAATIAHNLTVDALVSVREILGLPPTVSDLEIAKNFGPLLAAWLTAAATLEAGGRR